MEEKKGTSAIDFFCIGFGAIVGVGWAVSINSWMAGSGGPLPAAVGYLLALIIMIPISLCYCELCAMLPVSGGGMAYAFRAFGDNVAFISGWAAFGAFITIIPWEAIYVVDIMSIIIPGIKAGTPLYALAGADIYPGHILIGVAISVVLFLINRKGITSSAAIQRVLCFVLVGAGLLAMVFAMVKFDPANFEPVYENIGKGTHHSFFGGAMVIPASAPFFLAGFETIPQGIESAGGDVKSVGKTVVLTVVLSCLFYSALLFTLGGAMPWKEFIKFDSPSAALLFRDVYGGVIGKGLYLFILIGAISGLITTWNGFMMASSQILMAMFAGWMLVGLVLFIVDYRERRRYSKLKRASFLFASMMAQSDVKLPGFTEYFEDDYRYLSFVVPKEADYSGMTLMDLGWGKRQNIFIIKIEHGNELLFLPNARTRVYKNDRVFAVGVEKAVLKFRDSQYIGDKYTIGNLKDFMGFGNTEAQVPLVCQVVKVTADAPYCNKPLKYSGITDYTQCMVIGLQSMGKTFMMPDADTLIEEGDDLWIVGLEENIEKFMSI